MFNNAMSDLDVLVRNLSPTGACLSGAELIGLPDRFELRIHDPDGGESRRPVRRVWAHGERIGIEFLDPPTHLQRDG